MTKHLADHSTDTTPGRLARFLRIARSQSQTVWHRLWQAQTAPVTGNRRVVEFVRIARQKRD